MPFYDSFTGLARAGRLEGGLLDVGSVPESRGHEKKYPSQGLCSPCVVGLTPNPGLEDPRLGRGGETLCARSVHLGSRPRLGVPVPLSSVPLPGTGRSHRRRGSTTVSDRLQISLSERSETVHCFFCAPNHPHPSTWLEDLQALQVIELLKQGETPGSKPRKLRVH